MVKKYPFRNGAVTGVVCLRCEVCDGVCVHVRAYVCQCMSVISEVPLETAQPQSHALSFPLLTAHFAALPANEDGKAEPPPLPLPSSRDSTHSGSNTYNFPVSLATVLRAPVCSLILTDQLLPLIPPPLFFFFKKHAGAPWRFTVGMTSVQNTFCSSDSMMRAHSKGLLS